ncbi:MAG: YicC family protein [Clostridia bacterium]|nr:YicC family protein [Clostridia bacterium]
MKSMTGYGKAELIDGLLTITVEIRTVNNRFFDFSVKCPKALSPLQDVIKSTVSKHVSRGKVDVFINLQHESSGDKELEINEELLENYLKLALGLKSKYKLKNDFTVTTALKMPEIMREKKEEELDVDSITNALITVVENACNNLNAMRSFEGERLEADLLSRVDFIGETVLKIKERAPMVVIEFNKKLRERIEAVLDGNAELDEARLLQEVAIYADKLNIDEEITRLTSHVAHFKNICKEEKPVGKQLDFLIQEFNREANTICSKSNDIEVTDNALKLKCEIEKIREQIQNIE